MNGNHLYLKSDICCDKNVINNGKLSNHPNQQKKRSVIDCVIFRNGSNRNYNLRNKNANNERAKKNLIINSGKGFIIPLF